MVPFPIPAPLRGMDLVLIQVHPRFNEIVPVFLVGAVRHGNIGRIQRAGDQADGYSVLAQLLEEFDPILAGNEIGRLDENLLFRPFEFLVEPLADWPRLGRRIRDLARRVGDDLPVRPDERFSVIGEVRDVAVVALGIFFVKPFGVLNPCLQFVS